MTKKELKQMQRALEDWGVKHTKAKDAYLRLRRRLWNTIIPELSKMGTKYTVEDLEKVLTSSEFCVKECAQCKQPFPCEFQGRLYCHKCTDYNNYVDTPRELR